MRAAWSLAILAVTSSVAVAHGYHFGTLEIQHPAIIVPADGSDCTCAQMRIINHGPTTEYFLGADIEAASHTHLLKVKANAAGLQTPDRVAIKPGATLDLHRQEWRLFMSGIKTHLEADFGSLPGILHFEGRDTVQIEFMVDPKPQ
jgi:copper(I)-binding protein